MTSDHTLWKQIQDGNYHAYCLLFDRYWEKVYVIAFRYLNEVEASKEITHNVFLNLWRGKDHLEIRSFQAYLYSAARYQTYKYLKSNEKQALYFCEQSTLEQLSKETVINQAEYDGRINAIAAAKNNLLSGLPRRCREIFHLSREEQLSNSEISERLHISKRTVENQITYALKHLRTGLKKFLLL